jgi:hypothetical protein
MAHLQEDLAAVARSDEPLPEPLTAAQAALPLALGADGVMVPFRPEAGMPWEKIRWREVKVGVLDVYFINPTPVYFGVDKI